MKTRLNVLLYAIYAGLAIAFGGILFILCKAYIPDNSFFAPTLVGALLFPSGLLMVCFFKLNLFTGKIGMAFRNKKLDKKGLNVFEWLGIILLGNAIGAMALGFIVYAFTFIDRNSAFAIAINDIALSRSMSFDFQGIFPMIYRSILCGALVYIAVYLFNKLDSTFGKVVGIIIPIAFFVFCGFQHCIANMFYIAAGCLFNANTIVGLIICILGNSAGALLLDLFVKYE